MPEDKQEVLVRIEKEIRTEPSHMLLTLVTFFAQDLHAVNIWMIVRREPSAHRRDVHCFWFVSLIRYQMLKGYYSMSILPAFLV